MQSAPLESPASSVIDQETRKNSTWSRVGILAHYHVKLSPTPKDQRHLTRTRQHKVRGQAGTTQHMSVNRDKPGKWKTDIARSVDMYNAWFMKFAPKAFRTTRIQTTRDVEAALHSTGNLTNITPATIRAHPEILPTLRMSTCHPSQSIVSSASPASPPLLSNAWRSTRSFPRRCR